MSARRNRSLRATRSRQSFASRSAFSRSRSAPSRHSKNASATRRRVIFAMTRARRRRKRRIRALSSNHASNARAVRASRNLATHARSFRPFLAREACPRDHSLHAVNAPRASRRRAARANRAHVLAIPSSRRRARPRRDRPRLSAPPSSSPTGETRATRVPKRAPNRRSTRRRARRVLAVFSRHAAKARKSRRRATAATHLAARLTRRSHARVSRRVQPLVNADAAARRVSSRRAAHQHALAVDGRGGFGPTRERARERSSHETRRASRRRASEASRSRRVIAPRGEISTRAAPRARSFKTTRASTVRRGEAFRAILALLGFARGGGGGVFAIALGREEIRPIEKRAREKSPRDAMYSSSHLDPHAVSLAVRLAPPRNSRMRLFRPAMRRWRVTTLSSSRRAREWVIHRWKFRRWSARRIRFAMFIAYIVFRLMVSWRCFHAANTCRRSRRRPSLLRANFDISRMPRSNASSCDASASEDAGVPPPGPGVSIQPGVLAALKAPAPGLKPTPRPRRARTGAGAVSGAAKADSSSDSAARHDFRLERRGRHRRRHHQTLPARSRARVWRRGRTGVRARGTERRGRLRKRLEGRLG